MRRTILLHAVLYSCVLAVSAHAQQQKPEDPEDEKKVGLWLDQGISTSLSANKSLEIEFDERSDEGASNLFEYFVQAGVAFRPRQWLTLVPTYRYQRFTDNPASTYENRLRFDVTLSKSRGLLRYSLRTQMEGRFPDNTPASARLRFRPELDYTLPLRMTWRPVVSVSNEFFIVPWNNPYANGGTSYTKNRFQVGVRLPVTNSLTARPYCMLESENLPSGWDTNVIVGISLDFKVAHKANATKGRHDD